MDERCCRLLKLLADADQEIAKAKRELANAPVKEVRRRVASTLWDLRRVRARIERLADFLNGQNS